MELSNLSEPDRLVSSGTVQAQVRHALPGCAMSYFEYGHWPGKAFWGGLSCLDVRTLFSNDQLQDAWYSWAACLSVPLSQGHGQGKRRRKSIQCLCNLFVLFNKKCVTLLTRALIPLFSPCSFSKTTPCSCFLFFKNYIMHKVCF